MTKRHELTIYEDLGYSLVPHHLDIQTFIRGQDTYKSTSRGVSEPKSLSDPRSVLTPLPGLGVEIGTEVTPREDMLHPLVVSVDAPTPSTEGHFYTTCGHLVLFRPKLVFTFPIRVSKTSINPKESQSE